MYICGSGGAGRGVVLGGEKMDSAMEKGWIGEFSELLRETKDRTNGGVWSKGEICGVEAEETASEVGS